MQDTLEIVLDYVPRTSVLARGSTRTLFDSLVGIAHHRDRLHAYLSELKADAATSDKVAELASYLANFLRDLAETLDRHEPETYVQSTRGPETDELAVNVDVTSSHTELTYKLRTSGDRKVSVELARLDAAPLEFSPVDNPILSGGKTSYQNSADVGGARVGLAGLSGRRSTVTGLDILKQPTVMPAVKAFRNRDLGGIKVDNAFVLASQETKSSAELVAQLLQPSGSLSISTPVKTLSEQLKDFAEALFETDGADVSVDAHASLVIPMDASVSQLFRSPLGVLKGCRPDRAGSFVDAFAKWGRELTAAIGSGDLDPETPPQSVELSVTVYANYAGDLPVLVLPRLRVDWHHLKHEAPTLGGMLLRTWADGNDLVHSLYWLTGGWRVDQAKAPDHISQLRMQVAKLLRSSPCYNKLPDDQRLPLRERDSARMAAAWKECSGIVRMGLLGIVPDAKLLGWFMAPVDASTGELERDTLHRLLEGPLLPAVDWHLRIHETVESVWRASNDPFSDRKVALVEVLEGKADLTKNLKLATPVEQT